jgi:mono/diheme cytochrome c family protein
MSLEVRSLIAAALSGILVVALFFTIAALMSKLGSLQAPAGQGSTVGISTDQTDLQSQIIAGSQHFSESCASCHGADGSGGGGAPNLHNEDLSDQEIFDTISKGKGPMPPFAGTYNPHQISSMVAYVRSLK